jgi:hypothetical protein
VDVQTDEGRAEQPESTGRRRWLLPAALIAGLAIQILWRVWLAHYVITPIAHADEDRYLLAARVLAGGPGGLGNDTEAFRRLGYPLVLTPVYWFTSDPFRVYEAVQTIGAVINALTFPLAYLVARRMFAVSTWPALGLAFIAASLPAVAYFSEFALTDAIFAPIGLAWLLLMHGWMVGRTPVSRAAAGVGAGIVVGYAYVVHIRGMVMLAVFVLFGIVLLVTRRVRWPVVLGSLAAALAVTQVNSVANSVIGDRLVRGGIEPNSVMSARLSSAQGLVHAIVDAAGQLWAASVSTWGLGAVGFVVAVQQIRRYASTRDEWPRAYLMATAMVATILIALSSAIALPADGRITNHVYARYIAFLMPFWVLAGAAAILAAKRRDSFRLLGYAAALIGATAFLLLTRITTLYEEWYEAFDVPEISFLANNWDSLAIANASVRAIVVLAVVVAVATWRHRAALPVLLAGLLCINVAAMEAINRELIQPRALAQYRTAPLLSALGIGPGDVVASSAEIPLGARVNHQREVYWSAIIEFDTEESPPPEATVAIGPWEPRPQLGGKTIAWGWQGERGGWVRLDGDAVNGWAVWLRDTDPRVTGN